MNDVGVVVIGRNEGARLRGCFQSVRKCHDGLLIYVDSGSSDNSVEIAREFSSDIIQLDSSLPLSAAFARNSGFQKIKEHYPKIRYVQFVDGDCEVQDGWFKKARSTFSNEENKDVAIVRGSLREKDKDYSIYNRIWDIEWWGDAGEINNCGGIFMAKVEYFSQVDGFNNLVIAGEEPELCFRLQMAGKRIIRVRDEMAVHDSCMSSFSQWWKRMTRSGYAFAQGMMLHMKSPGAFCVKESIKIWLWGMLFPVLTLLAAYFVSSWFLVLLLIYPIKILKICVVSFMNILNVGIDRVRL
ncbi:glycosyltransferase [Moorena bouillonii]|uniref:Glycosyltransferase 2-like domain-containing protein n=1 Tax=Moorena bouillonii PNG TaxID=568701 RepID=A0A1U7N733_9CYAN|nr:glycosyltransferase family 2 protein [Moorena bouillonii]OLT61752.1 hypothetical protein BJP37_24720 [Moorena bouillonii PNG]